MHGHLNIAEAILKQHEGLSLEPYYCPAGKLTIGYGRNLEAKGISRSEAEYLLVNDIYECEQDLQRFRYWQELNDTQKAALIDMRYCLGPRGYRSFGLMAHALDIGDHEEAAKQVLNSLFAKQVPNRAQDIADMLTLREDT